MHVAFHLCDVMIVDKIYLHVSLMINNVLFYLLFYFRRRREER